MLKSILIAPLLYLFVQANETVTYVSKVIGVKDGDTIEVLHEGKGLVIRLEHIDCPEIGYGQPYCQVAKKFVSELCFGKTVHIVHSKNFDRYGRLIGVVMVNDSLNLNKELVSAGLAWHYKRYSKDESYAVLEEEARAAGRNIWSRDSPTPPWDWRVSVSSGQTRH